MVFCFKKEAENKRRNVFIVFILSVIVIFLFTAGLFYKFVSQYDGLETSKEAKTTQNVPTKNATRVSSSKSTSPKNGSTQSLATVKSRIYFTSDGSGVRSIYSVDEEGKDEQMIYDTSEFDSMNQLSVSPDGHFIMFTKMKVFDHLAYMIKTDGTGFKELGKGSPVSFSHNGNYALIENGPTVKILKLPSCDIAKEWNVSVGIHSLGFSIDDEGIIFRDHENDSYFMRNIKTNEDSKTEEIPSFVVSPDGKKRILLSREKKEKEKAMRSIFISNLDGTEEYELGKFELGNFCPCWHRDGKRLLIAERGPFGDFVSARILELDENRTKVIKKSKIIVKGPFNTIRW